MFHPMRDLWKQSVADDSHGRKSLVRNAKGEAEKKAISGALEETHWNRKAAARLLRISYRALLYKIQEYQMRPSQSYISELATETAFKRNGRGE
jgi:DNA-binding NtrC family response regulator